MIFNIFENMKFNPLLAPSEDPNSIEKRRLDLLEFFKREFVIFRRFAASKRRSKTTVPNMRNVINEGMPKDVDQKINLKVAKIEDDVEDRNYTALSKELGFEPESCQSDLLGANTEKETNDNPNEKKEENEGQEIEKKDINNDNNVEKDNKEGNINLEAANIKENDNSEKKTESKDEEKKEVDKTKENEDPNKKKEINFKVDDKIKNRLNFINNYNKPDEEKKESKVIDIRKLCAMEIEEQKKEEKK